MSNQPKLPVGDQLTAYAAARRGQMGAPPALPPAARRALLAAVAQHFDTRGARAGSRWCAWLGTWPRVAWAAALFVVLAAGGGAVWVARQSRPSPPTELARQSTPVPDSALGTPPSPPVSAPAVPPPASAPSAAPPIAEQLGLPMLATASAPQPREIVSQAFRQVAHKGDRDGDPAVAARLPVLERFHVESRGNRLRIIDADGSVYEGHLLAFAAPASPPDKPRTGVRTRSPGIAPSGAAAPRPDLSRSGPTPESPRLRESMTIGTSAAVPSVAELLFEAAGTNRSIEQSVSIAGRFVVTNAIPADLAGPGRSGQGVPESFQRLLSNSVMRGQAVLDGRQTIDISAVPARP